MANEYVDRATLKLALGLTDTDRDALLDYALAAASRAIDRMTGRRFWLDPAPVQRVFHPYDRTVRDGDSEQLLVHDIGSDEGLVVEFASGGPWNTVTGYETTPDNALADGLPITGLLTPYGSWGHGRGARVRVTARWGWPTVPEEVAQATLIQATRLFRRKDSPEGVTGSAEWGAIRLSRVDPDVAALVEHLTLPGFG